MADRWSSAFSRGLEGVARYNAMQQRVVNREAHDAALLAANQAIALGQGREGAIRAYNLALQVAGGAAMGLASQAVRHVGGLMYDAVNRFSGHAPVPMTGGKHYVAPGLSAPKRLRIGPPPTVDAPMFGASPVRYPSAFKRLRAPMSMPRGRMGTTLKHALECVDFKVASVTGTNAFGTGTYQIGIVNPMTGIDVGAGQGERVGRRIWASQLVANVAFETVSGTLTTADNGIQTGVALPLAMMALVVIDRLHNGAADITTILSTLYDATIAPSDGFPLRTIGNLKRYQIVRAKLFRFVRPVSNFGSTALFTAAGWQRAVRWTIKFKKPLAIEFIPISSASGPTDTLVNYPFVVASLCDVSVAAGSISWSIGTRLTYTD